MEYLGRAVTRSVEEGLLPPEFGGWGLGVYPELEHGGSLLNLLMTLGGNCMVTGIVVWSLGLLSTAEPFHVIKLYFKVCGVPLEQIL